jgi:SAM-dependent methyltransferase
MKKQAKIWETHTEKMQIEDLVRNAGKPSVFQNELKIEIDKCVETCGGEFGRTPEIIEVGCEYGVTSLILSDKFNKTLLDLNPRAIELSKALFAHYNKKAHFVVADMFNMPFENESYDIVFNAGVLEHFTRKEIIRALTEYKRILKNDGIIYIGIPNQFSVPYKSAQLVRQLFRKWEFPYEYCYYNLKKEIETAGLMLEKREVLSKESIYNWWNFAPIIQKFFLKTDKIFNWEGYLILLTIKKTT